MNLKLESERHDGVRVFCEKRLLAKGLFCWRGAPGEPAAGRVSERIPMGAKRAGAGVRARVVRL